MRGRKPQMGSVREYIEDLEAKFGGLRAAGRALGIDYQRLQYYKRAGHKLQEFLDFLESSRVCAKLSKSAAWDRVVSKKS